MLRPSNLSGDSPMARKKIALVGAGMIGGTLAHICSREEQIGRAHV